MGGAIDRPWLPLFIRLAGWYGVPCNVACRVWFMAGEVAEVEAAGINIATTCSAPGLFGRTVKAYSAIRWLYLTTVSTKSEWQSRHKSIVCNNEGTF